MNFDSTVSTARETPVTAGLAAPNATPPAAGTSASASSSTASKYDDPSVQAPSQPPVAPRRWPTWGKVMFDLKTYLGFGLIGNEITSFIITDQAEKGIGKHWHAKNMAYFRSLEGKPYIPKYVSQGHLFNVLLAVIGGMFMVPLIKNEEDHSDPKIRDADRKHYGDKVDTDPSFAEYYKKLDAEPKQSWGSLWKGRVFTVIGAIILDVAVGCKDALSNNLFPNNKTFQKYANMDRIANEFSQKTMDALKIKPSSRPMWDRALYKSSWLLIFSSSLAAVFYISSRIFAKRRDLKLERQHHQPYGKGVAALDGTTPDGIAPDAEREPVTEPASAPTSAQPPIAATTANPTPTSDPSAERTNETASADTALGAKPAHTEANPRAQVGSIHREGMLPAAGPQLAGAAV